MKLNTCPKCGAENKFGAKFCSSCGTRLGKQKVACPNCGAMNITDNKFCIKCGQPLDKVVKASKQVPAKEVTKVSKPASFGVKTRTVRNVKITGLAVAAVALLLIFIGFFGACLKANIHSTEGSSSITQNSLEFFFKDGWKTFFGDATKGIKSNILNTQRVAFVFYFVSYIVMMAAIISTIIMVSMKAYKIYVKKDLNIKLSKEMKWIIIASVIYIIFGMMMNYMYMYRRYPAEYGYYTSEKVLYGWGSILIIIGIMFSIVSLSLYEYNGQKQKALGQYICAKLPLILVVFIAIFGFGAVLGYRINGTDVYQTSYACIFNMFVQTDYRASFIAPTCFALIAMIGMAVMVTLMLAITSEKEQIAFSAILLVLSILAGVLLLVAFNKNFDFIYRESEEARALYSVKFGWAFIVDIVLSSICLGTSITSYKLKTLKA